MIKKLLNGQSKTIISGAVIIGAASLASRILGILRDRILAGEFGAGEVLDAYYAAFRIPDLVFNLIVLGALSAGFIPIFTGIYLRDKNKANELAALVFNILLVFLVVVCGVLIIFTPQLMKYIAPGFNVEQLSMTIMLTRIMFLSPVLLGLSSIFGGILQSLKHFVVYSLAPIFYNIGIIIGVLVFVNIFGIIGLAYGVILGAAMHMVIQFVAASHLGFRFKPVFNFKNKELRKICRIMIPRTLTLGINQINLLIITIIATILTTGSLAIFNLANNLQYFPIGIFGISFAIAAFPTLSEFAAKEDKKGFIRNFSSTVREILFFIIPASALFIVLRAQIVRVVLGTGAFDWAATIATADVLAIFALSMFAQALIPLLIRGFYAFHNAVTPFLISLTSVIINVVLSLYLTSTWIFENTGLGYGVIGLALAFTLSSIIQCVLLWIALRIKMGSLQEAKVLWAGFKILVASIIMVVVTQFMKFGVEPFFGTETFMGVFLQGALSGLVGIAVFIVSGLVLRSKEMYTFVASVRNKLFKKKEVYPQTGIDENVEV